MDFGIARLVEETQRFTQVGMTIGTAGYLSPEQLQGLDIDHRSDIFSFGVLGYELLTYQPPFEGDSISALFYSIAHDEPPPLQEVWPACPPGLAACITRCLEKDPDARYRDLGKVNEDLQAVLDELVRAKPGVAGRPEGAPAGFVGAEAAEGGTKRYKWLIPVWAVVGIALLVAVFEVFRFAVPGQSQPSSGGEPAVVPGDTSGPVQDSSELPQTEGAEVAPDAPGFPAEAPDTLPARATPVADPAGVMPETGPEPAVQDSVAEAAEPYRGSATLVLFWSSGGDPESATTAENAFLEEFGRRRHPVVEAGLLAGIHTDATAMAMAQGLDARAISALGREYDAEIVVVGSLRTETEPSAGRFFTGRAVLDVRTYRASTEELLGSGTYQVGSGDTPGELGPSRLAAETGAATEAGRRAAVGIAREFGEAIPRRR
jgi:hypothetical protein